MSCLISTRGPRYLAWRPNTALVFEVTRNTNSINVVVTNVPVHDNVWES